MYGDGMYTQIMPLHTLLYGTQGRYNTATDDTLKADTISIRVYEVLFTY